MNNQEQIPNNRQEYLHSYLDFITNKITLQEFVDKISNHIENNRVREYLNQFLNATQEIDEHYGLINQEKSNIYDFHGKDGNIYKYYIRKVPYSNHYCIYIILPNDHVCHGNSYDDVPDATYSAPLETDINQWVIGWDYARYNICNPSILYFQLISNNGYIANLDILTVSRIENDISTYVNWLSNP